MNKSIVILLAVCLISVHAFVKRDTENTNQFDSLTKQTQELVQGMSKKLEEAFKPDNIKKQFDDAFDTIKKAVDSLGTKTPAKEST